MIEANEIVAPVMFAECREGGTFEISGNILGSCFPIGGNFCLTAGHVVLSVQDQPIDKVAVLGLRKNSRWVGAEIVNSEVLDADIGLLQFNNPNGLDWGKEKAFSWDLNILSLLQQVKTCGYPYGTNLIDIEMIISLRAFFGHIVSVRNKYIPIGYKGKCFSVYELSFSVPRGLSGAPLYIGDSPTLVCGLNIGNSESKMLVHQSTERTAEGNIERVMEYYEYLHLGIAVQASTIVNIESKLLKAPILQHLKRNGLIR